jgi:hypothetical protein
MALLLRSLLLVFSLIPVPASTYNDGRERSRRAADSDADLESARRAFRRLEHAARLYDASMRRVSPLYDSHSRPGPPFDAQYHLEVLDRARAILSEWVRDSRDEWADLNVYVSNDSITLSAPQTEGGGRTR